MKKLINSSIFIVGFLCGLPLFLLLAFLARKLEGKDEVFCPHCVEYIGFPFAFYRVSSFAAPAGYLRFGLIADVLIVIGFSFVVGLIFKLFWEKFTIGRLK